MISLVGCLRLYPFWVYGPIFSEHTLKTAWPSETNSSMS
jgi:hypothetical protein